MDPIFSRLLEQHTPKVNDDVMNGLACVYMQYAEEYLDKVIKSASRSFSEGVKYLGYARCSPSEEYMEITKLKNNKRTFDIAKSDIYLVKYLFSFNGEELPPRYVYLPYVTEAGIMQLSGASYHITPVLSDKVISPGYDTVFVRLLRYKRTFKRLYHSIVIDGNRETSHVVWSQIYSNAKSDKKVPTTTKAKTSIVHYLYAKYGFFETFQKYCGFIPIVGTSEINETTYPVDQWVICQSSQVKPKTFIGEYYTPSTLRLAIPRDQWNSLTKALAIGFIYVVDHFPERFNMNQYENKNHWRILLGHIIFSGAYGENKLYADICDHFNFLDDYVDTIIVEKLKDCGYIVNDFYDLLALLASEFNSLVLDAGSASLNMYNKSLEILYYVFYDITAGIFNVNYRLSKRESRQILTKKDVIDAFTKHMKTRSILKLNTGKIVTEAVAYSGDHKYFKITSKITEQESLPGGTRSKSKRFVLGQDKHLDVSMIEVGSLLFLPKSNPTPISKINPFVKVDLKTGTLLHNEKFTEDLSKTHQLLKGKLP